MGFFPQLFFLLILPPTTDYFSLGVLHNLGNFLKKPICDKRYFYATLGNESLLGKSSNILFLGVSPLLHSLSITNNMQLSAKLITLCKHRVYVLEIQEIFNQLSRSEDKIPSKPTKWIRTWEISQQAVYCNYKIQKNLVDECGLATQHILVRSTCFIVDTDFMSKIVEELS